MERFQTLQGEGAFAGHAALFLRLALCDVGCVWCDVKESWTLSDDQWQSLTSVQKSIEEARAKIVVVTGGEPTLHPLEKLSAGIHRAGKRAHIETAGTNPLTGQWDWVTLSPKKFKPCLEENYQHAHELKVVVFHPSDLKWAEELAEKCLPSCKLYLQAEWSKTKKISPLLVNYIKENPKWALSLQSHKYIDIP